MKTTNKYLIKLFTEASERSNPYHTPEEIEDYVVRRYGERWADFYLELRLMPDLEWLMGVISGKYEL